MFNNMKSLLLLLLATFATQVKEGRSCVYWARVWTEPNYQGVYYEFNEDVPYLSSYNFDNTISSIQVNGVWILYNEPEYNTYQTSIVHWAWGLDKKENLHGTDNQISSLRYAGSQSKSNEAGYNLYAGEMFTKKDLYGTSDIPDLSQFHQEVKSVIIIGQSSWTFCEQANYSGRCVCMAAKQHDSNSLTRLDVGFYQRMSDYYMYNVTSVRKGC
ncbi:gamma-crystallin S-like [Scylla paramamosain]|uniref:gamma-crystallin S-like n=1 Tax=Scylla paramamosain TaxID=85552 RepID=UPI0030838ED7